MDAKRTYCGNHFTVSPYIKFRKSQLNSVVGGQLWEDRFLDKEIHWQGLEG